MNHRTRGPDAFTGPAELYQLVGELILLVDGLPQLLNQLGRWLHTEHDADRVRSDNHADPGPTVTQATTQMAAPATTRATWPTSWTGHNSTWPTWAPNRRAT